MQGQSRAMSIVESVANVAVGYGVAVCAQILVFPLFGIDASLGANLGIGAIFTVVSLCRSYALRRLFNYLHQKGPHGTTAERECSLYGHPGGAEDR